MEKSNEVLEQLGLSASEVQLFLTLVQRGALTARELTKLTRAKRPTVYYALRQLMDRGLVTRRGAAAAERFQAEPPESLQTLVSLRQQEVSSLSEKVAALIPHLQTAPTAHEGTPGVLFFEGADAMKRAIMDTLYCKSGHIDSLAPADNFFWQIGQEFSQRYIDERVRRAITTRNLWEKPLEPKILLKSYHGLSQVKILPAVMHGAFRTTIFLYDQEVMYISSVESGYVLIVKSREHYELMKAVYEALWLVSEEVKI